MKKAILLELLVTLMVLLFLYASFSKLVNMEAYRHAMYNQPFPRWFANFLVWTIPPAEILVSAMLVFNRTRTYGIYAFLMLMVLFTGYIAAIMLHLFRRIPCFCGGIIQELNWEQHLFFNLSFIIITCLVLKINKQLKINEHQV